MRARRRGSEGSVFLDVLVAILIASVAMLVTLGGIALTSRVAARSGSRTRELINARSEYVKTREMYFGENPLRN